VVVTAIEEMLMIAPRCWVRMIGITAQLTKLVEADVTSTTLAIGDV
jgi:hypothetical protein